MHTYLKPDSNYAKLSLDERLAKANLNFIPRLVPDTFTVDGLTWDTGEKVVVRPTQADKDGNPINPRIATVGQDYCLTDYYELFSRFDQPLLDSGFKPSGCQSFKGGGGARMFYTKPGEGFGRTGGHKILKNAPRATVFYIKTGINGLWSTGFGGYLFEQWCSNGASKQIWTAYEGGIRHTKTHNDRLEDAITRFDWLAADMADFSRRLDAIEKIKADENLVKEFTLALIPNTDSESKARENQRTALTNHIKEQAFTRNREITFQDLLQGVTAYNTHEKAKNAESVFERVLTGKGVQLFDQAVNWVDARV